MNILIFTEDYHPNIDGGALVRSRFTELVEQTPHELTVITGRPNKSPFEDEHHGARVVRTINPSPGNIRGYEFGGFLYRIMFSLTAFIIGFSIIWRNDIDVLYSKSYSTHWAGKLLSFVFSRPLLTFIGGTPSLGNYKSSQIKLIPEWINMRFFMGDFVFTRTPHTSNRVTKISGKPSEVLHGVLNKRHIQLAVSGCDSQQIRNKYNINETDHLLVFVGRLVPLKNPTKAVEVLSKLPPNYRLIIIGDGPERKTLQKQIEALNLTDRVHLAGQVPHQTALEIVYSADAQLVTSKIEAYPSVVFEGLALNNEVFSRDVGVVSEISEESLHITEDFVNCIECKSIEQQSGIDERILDKYSIERYTEESINMMNKIVVGEENP